MPTVVGAGAAIIYSGNPAITPFLTAIIVTIAGLANQDKFGKRTLR